MIIKFVILANVCLTIGLLLNYALPPIISKLIDKQIALEPGSKSYPMWLDPPVPIYQKFYFYNVTNSQQIEQFGHKPNLVEIGPFTYRISWSRQNIEINNDTIGYKQYKTWHFEPDLSVADQSLEIITLNAPLAITMSLIQSASNAVRLLVTFSLDGLSEGFFTRRSIRQLLFDGYPDLLTTFGPLLNAEMLSQGGKFGYMNARNNTLDGTYEINSGVQDIDKLNTIVKYNGRPKLLYWNDSPAHCNSLEGSSLGELFPPVKREHQEEQAPNDGTVGPVAGGPDQLMLPLSPPDGRQSIKMFQPDFCRVWRLDLDSEYEQPPSGLKLKRFRASRDVFKNSTELPNNSCFFASPASHHSRRTSSSQSSSGSTANSHHSNHNHNHHRTSGNNNNHQSANNRIGRQNRQAAASGSGLGATRHQHHGRVRQEWPTGVFSLAPCKFNAPIYMSMPHFLDADAQYLSRVDGLEPDPSRHDFFVDLEPRTGSPVALAARVQLNVAISKPPGLVRFRNIPEIMFPVFWQELSVNLTDNGPVVEQLLLASRGAQDANTRISYTFLILGMVILTTSCLFHLKARLRARAENK